MLTKIEYVAQDKRKTKNLKKFHHFFLNSNFIYLLYYSRIYLSTFKMQH